MYAKGRGVEQNYVESLKWYKMAAEQGDITAQATLGMMFAKGIGCEKNNEVALHWYQKAASKGDVKAQYNLGNMYSKGLGTDVDDSEAFHWYQKLQNRITQILNSIWLTCTERVWVVSEMM